MRINKLIYLDSNNNIWHTVRHVNFCNYFFHRYHSSWYFVWKKIIQKIHQKQCLQKHWLNQKIQEMLCHFFQYHKPLEYKLPAMAPHSSTLAWEIPWMEEPGRLQSMGSRRVGHDWATSLSLLTFLHWRRKWQPTPVFLPGESQGWGSLVGCRLWGRTESDTTEVT